MSDLFSDGQARQFYPTMNSKARRRSWSTGTWSTIAITDSNCGSSSCLMGARRWETADSLFRMSGNKRRAWMAKVPISGATKAVWQRYCQAVGVGMGEGVALLMLHELASVAWCHRPQ